MEHETTYFRDPGAPVVVQSLASAGGAGAAAPAPRKEKSRSNPRDKTGKVSTTGDLGESGNLSDKQRMETLILTIEALRAQMEDQVRAQASNRQTGRARGMGGEGNPDPNCT